MGIPIYLAMTAAGFQEAPAGAAAWMACRFSSWSRGLSNLPASLSPGSLLILTDETPIRGHDPALCARELGACLEAFSCRGVVADFQRERTEEGREMVRALRAALPCPLAAPPGWEEEGPVFLPPLPHCRCLEAYLAPWRGKEVWLDLAPTAETIRLTARGAAVRPGLPGEAGFPDPGLHCHYSLCLREDAAEFSLWRTGEDLLALLREAEGLGVRLTVGLWEELRGLPGLGLPGTPADW